MRHREQSFDRGLAIFTAVGTRSLELGAQLLDLGRILLRRNRGRHRNRKQQRHCYRRSEPRHRFIKPSPRPSPQPPTCRQSPTTPPRPILTACRHRQPSAFAAGSLQRGRSTIVRPNPSETRPNSPQTPHRRAAAAIVATIALGSAPAVSTVSCATAR